MSAVTGKVVVRTLLAAAALLCVSLEAVIAQGRRSRPAQPFFKLRLEDPGWFQGSRYAPLFADLRGVMLRYFGLGAADGERAEAMWAALSWPIEVTVLIDRQTALPMVGVSMPAGGQGLLGGLAALAGEAGERQTFEHDGALFEHVGMTTPDGEYELTACEGVIAGRRLLLVGRRDSIGAPADALARFLKGSGRSGPAQRALAAHAEGGEVGWVFDFRSLVSSISPDDIPQVHALAKLLLGPRFGGMSGRMSAAGDGLVIDLFADIRPGRGWVGTAAHREPRELDLARWVPAEVSDYTVVDVSVGGVLRLLRSMSFFGGDRLAPGDFFSELRWLDVDLMELLDIHLTGQVVGMKEVFDADDEGSLRDLEGVVIGVGVFDAPRLIDEVRDLIADSPEGLATIAGAPEVGPGVLTVTWRGRPEMFIAAGEGAVFIARPDAAGGRLLRECLATGGRGQRAGSRVCTMLGRGHVLKHAMGELFPRRWPGEGPPVDAATSWRQAVPGALRRFLVDDDGVAEWRLTLTPAGTTLRVEL